MLVRKDRSHTADCMVKDSLYCHLISKKASKQLFVPDVLFCDMQLLGTSSNRWCASTLVMYLADNGRDRLLEVLCLLLLRQRYI